VITQCIEKSKATTDRDQIAHLVSEVLGFLQVDEEPESDAFALLGSAIEDAADEAAKPEPDKEEVGDALERAVKYAKAAEDFGEHAEKLLPRLAALASWLGPVGHSLLSMVGLA